MIGAVRAISFPKIIGKYQKSFLKEEKKSWGQHNKEQ